MVTRVYYLLQKYCRDAINSVSTFLIVVFICFLFIDSNYNNVLAFSLPSNYQPIQVIDGAGLNRENHKADISGKLNLNLVKNRLRSLNGSIVFDSQPISINFTSN